MSGDWDWLIFAVAGAAMYLSSVLLYFHTHPQRHYSLRLQPEDEPGLALALRFLGFVGIFVGAITLSKIPGQAWNGALVILGGFAVPFAAVLLGNRTAKRQRGKSV